MSGKRYFWILVVLNVIIVKGKDIQDDNSNEESYFSILSAEYRKIFNNIPTIFEYLVMLTTTDNGAVDAKDSSHDKEKQDVVLNDGDTTLTVNDGDDNSEDIVFFIGERNSKVSLTAEEVVEQILKVEHELEEYNDKYCGSR